MWGLLLLWAYLVLPVSGYEDVKGPKEMSGFEGDTLAVRCTYSKKWIKHGKYWCRQGGHLISRCSNTIYTRGDQEVTQDRVSIRDSPQELAFTVTVKHLTLQDAGKYWCGINILGFDQVFEVTLTIFPGNRGGTASTTGPSCPPPTPSFQPLTTKPSLQRPQPKTKAWHTQPPALTSSDLRPTVATAKQGRAGVEATPSPRAVQIWPAGPSPYTGTSPQTETSPHTTTSPHAGSSRPAIPVHPTTAEDASPVPGGGSSKHRVTIPMVRMLAPVLVILSLLLATCLIAFGSHVFRWRTKAQLAMETQRNEQKNEQRDDKVYLPDLALGNGWAPEDTVISLAGPIRPGDSPEPSASPCKGIQHFPQAEEEEAPSEDPKEGMILAPPLQMSQEELGFSEFISV
ncbi:CMRF35-like molecule 9 isoform X2 [Perognathus longimembris pacificus]|uniref:CMRF35-like molecule 9 isoform X2 n=1 Tax=Perognathus longimembris pacificus TaxID=214514 RepID=UPI002019BDE0|nr:CMRF35-like molecule 9 isoform X2 [Perognathus longimembris pacificus]